MKKLDKSAIAEKQAISSKLSTTFEELEQKIDAFNGAMDEAWAKVALALDEYNSTLDEQWGNELDPAITAYNEAISDANSWREERGNEIQEYIDARSDKWREGEACGRYESWKEAYDTEFSEADFERPDDLELEEPERFEIGEMENAVELLDQLPEELED